MKYYSKNYDGKFKISNDYIGWLDTTYLSSYTKSINYLHEQILDNELWGWMLEDYPKSKFEIFWWDGKSYDKWDNPKEIKLYTLSCSQIRKMIKNGINF